MIGPEQGEAILSLEGEGRQAGGRRRAVVAEVLGYLGGVLAVVAGFVLGAESWGQLGPWGRAAVLAALTGVLLGARWWLRGSEGRVLPRLASVLWLFAVAGFAGRWCRSAGPAPGRPTTSASWLRASHLGKPCGA